MMYRNLGPAGSPNGQGTAEISLASVGDPLRLRENHYEYLLMSLGVSGMDEEGLRGRAQLYDGDVAIHQESPNCVSIAISMANRSV